MSMMAFGLGGGGGYAAQGSDPKLGDKLAALKRKGTSPDDRLEAFLTRDIGVDPRSLPFTPVTLREYLKSRLWEQDWDQMRFNGTSMELRQVVSSGYDTETDVATSTSPEWPDLVKAFEAMTREHPDYYTFNVVFDSGDISIVPIEGYVPATDPVKYPPGSVLRIQRQTPQGDQLVVERRYIRIGGLVDDTTPTILDTMQPMTDLTGWSVIEELS